MCGITGFIGKGLNEAVLQAMCDSIKHRGPDDSGIALFEGGGLANTRLSILDLSNAGHQPMSFKGHTIVFNGEVYNFKEIKQKLETKGHSFVSNSDTEVVLHAYVEWGKDCLELFNGMFGFAIWDGKELFIARDRLGIKPVYYLHNSRGLWFGSEIKAILADPRVKKHSVLMGYTTTSFLAMWLGKARFSRA